MRLRIKIIAVLLLLCSLIILGTDSYQYKKNLNSNNQLYEYINTEEDIINDELVEHSISCNELQLDVASLKSINSDFVGWVYLPYSTINYPVVQYDNNDFYLSKSFSKEKDKYGSIFVDCNVDLSSSDLVLIHGHNSARNNMYGTLDNYIWYNDYYDTHSSIYLAFAKDDYKFKEYKVKAAVVIDDVQATYSSLLETDYLSLFKNSNYRWGTVSSDVNSNVILSTCYGKSNTTKRLLILLQN